MVVLPLAAVVTVLFFASFDSMYTSSITFPPFAGIDHEIVSKSTPAVAPGADIVAGTVVTVTALDAVDAADVP